MFNGKGIMQTTIKLTEKQVALLLQILDEQISVGNIDPSDKALADEVLEILETAENKITSLSSKSQSSHPKLLLSSNKSLQR